MALLYGTNKDKQGIGFGLALSTQGRNTDGSKTTSVMLIDGAKMRTVVKKLTTMLVCAILICF